MRKKLLLISILLVGLSLSGCDTHTFTNFVKNVVKSTGPRINDTYRVKKFNRITAKTNNADLVFQNGKHFLVKYEASKKLAKDTPKVTVKNKHLIINASKPEDLNNSFQIITIQMPSKILKSIRLSSSNGDITTGKINCITGSFTAENGDIEVNNLLNKKHFDLYSDNGDIRIKHTKMSDFSLSTDNGDITVNGNKYDDAYRHNSSASDLIYADNNNGDIMIN